MRLLTRLLEPKATAYAHCDLPCGVYDPAQARIEAESVKAIEEKYQQNTTPSSGPGADHQGAAFRAGQAPPVGAVDRLLQAAALREVPAAAHAVQRGHQAGRRRPAPRAARTSARPTSCWPRSRRSARSSGRPSRPDRRAAPYRVMKPGAAPRVSLRPGARGAGSQVTQGDIGTARRFSRYAPGAVGSIQMGS